LNFVLIRTPEHKTQMSYALDEYLDELALIGAQMKIIGRRLDVVRMRLPDHFRQQIDRMDCVISHLPDIGDRLLSISDSSVDASPLPDSEGSDEAGRRAAA
jgi:hypothetical protein